MSIESHLISLREKHAELDRRVQDEQHRPWPNEAEVKRMKIEKLHLKEQIGHISAQCAVDR